MNYKLFDFPVKEKLKEDYSLKTLKFKKMNFNSINKIILKPIFNSKSVVSTAYKTNISLGKFMSKKLENKIKSFKMGKDLNKINQIQSYKDKSRINLNLISNKNKSNISNRNMEKFTPFFFQLKTNKLNSISFGSNNALSNSKSQINENCSSLIKTFDINEKIFLSKKENSSINKWEDEFSIKIKNSKSRNKELKSIFKINNNKNSNLSIKINPENKIILKSNTSRKIILSKYKKFDIVKKNKKFLNFLNSVNNKIKLEDIEQKRKKEIKNNKEMAKKIYKESQKNKEKKKNNIPDTLNYFKVCKRNIFMKINVLLEIKLNNIGKNNSKIKAGINIQRSIIQYLSLNYDFQKELISCVGFFSLKDKQKLPSFINKYLLKQNALRINLENELNPKSIYYKDKHDKNNCISKLSLINKRHNKRNSLITSNKYRARFSLLNNIEFFHNKKKENEDFFINYTERKKSFCKRVMYTNLNRKNSIHAKQILKNEDFFHLRTLIQFRKEQQFVFEFHKLNNIYDINSSDKDGNTLLTYACMNGEYYIAKYLLSNGANPNCINKYKNTPLHYALSNKYYKLADLLINNKAKDDIKNIYGLTPW